MNRKCLFQSIILISLFALSLSDVQANMDNNILLGKHVPSKSNNSQGNELSSWSTYSVDGNLLYLPLVSKPCVTPNNPISNGDFEMGVVAWIEGGQYVQEGSIIRNDLNYLIPGSFPHSGKWVAAIRAGYNPDLSKPRSGYVEQVISVPSDCAYLTYWYWVKAVDLWCPSRCMEAFIQINGSTVKIHDLNYDSTAWHKSTIDLKDYAGQVVNLRIYVEGNAYSNPYFVVDDVVFQ